MKTHTLKRIDYAAYTFIALTGMLEHEKTISAQDEKTARKEFWETMTDAQRDSIESIELVEVERF